MSYFTLNNLWVLIRQLADIACVWALVYYCLKIVKNNSRTIQIFKGILLVIIVKAIATYLELNTIAAMTTSMQLSSSSNRRFVVFWRKLVRPASFHVSPR